MMKMILSISFLKETLDTDNAGLICGEDTAADEPTAWWDLTVALDIPGACHRHGQSPLVEGLLVTR